MSTVPGRESWEDAGLTGPGLEDVVEIEDLEDEEDEAEPEEYLPVDSPPDPLDANEADVAEQLTEVPADETEEYR